MSLVRTCDVCYRDQYECSIVTYKVKKENYSSIFVWDAWDNVDICTECLREIRRIVKRGGATDETRGNN